MTSIKVGQVWRDKDKRRSTVIEILSLHRRGEGSIARAIIVGTEQEREYNLGRLQKRWELVEDKSLSEQEVDDLVSSRDSELATPEVERFSTREQWLTEAVKVVTEKVFAPQEIEVPEVRVSVGWPGGRGKKAGVIGQCFATSQATDGIAQIFVSPQLADSVAVLRTLTHELVHAIDDCKDGHKGNFIRIAKLIGFQPKFTSSENIGEELALTLKEIAGELGKYPHAALSVGEKPVVQKTYMIKVISINDEDYFVRMTQTKIDEYGLPIDPWGSEMVPEEK